jgi:nucleotide-binding universal stress UspA family protein
MYKSILVPLDGTRRSEAILPQVESLAQQCGASIILLEVLEPPPPHAVVVIPDMMKEGAIQRASEITEYINDIQRRLSDNGHVVQAIVERGPVVDTILKVAQSTRAELIAMSSRGYTGLARLLHGSVAGEILHRSKTPLLVLHVEDDDA